MIGLIGTYRGMRYVPRLLESLEEHSFGLDHLVFIDDSGSAQTASELSEFGEVVQTHGQGYNAAMRAAVARGAQENEHVVWLEEDFWLTDSVDFEDMAIDLDEHPTWAQIVLQRPPYYDTEIQAGGIVQYHQARGKEFHPAGDYWVHDNFFSGNPSIWRREILQLGWPKGDSSEALQTVKLRKLGYKFAMTNAHLCEHDGEHLGTGY